MRRNRLLSVPLALTLLLLGLQKTSPALGSAREGGSGERSRARTGGRSLEGRCRVCTLAHRLGLRMTPLPKPRVFRCTCDETPLRATLPRGRVRAEDLARVEVELGLELFDVAPDFEADPHLEVRLGSALLGRLRLSGQTHRECTAFGPALRNSLRGLRGRITWGRFDVEHHEALAHVWLDPPIDRELDRLHAIGAGTADEPPWVRQLFEAQVLSDQAFDTAALRTARAILERRSREPHAAAIAYASMLRLGLEQTSEGGTLAAEVIHPVRQRRRAGGARCDLDLPSPGSPRRRDGVPTSRGSP